MPTLPSPHREEAAFTLIEVIVALAVSLLVIGLAYAVYAQASRHVQQWRQKSAAENALHLALRLFSQDVRAAEQVQRVSLGRVTLCEGEHRIRYVRQGKTLLRNGRAVVPENFPAAKIALGRDSSAHAAAPTGRAFRTGGGRRLGAKPLLSLRIVLSVPGGPLQGTATARPRRSGGWGKKPEGTEAGCSTS